MKICEKKGQGHLFTFDPGLSYYDNFEHLLKNHWASCNKLSYRASLGLGNFPGHMTNMAAMPCLIMVKTFKTLLLWNQPTYDLFTQVSDSGPHGPLVKIPSINDDSNK